MLTGKNAMKTGKAEILFFADSPERGFGATVKLESGEPCRLSISQSGIRVKKSRFGLLGAILYNETNSDINAQRAGALAYLFPDQKFPDGISSPNLRAFVNAVLHCSNAAEVSRTLNEAVQLAERKAMRPFSEFQVWDFPLWSLPYQWSG